MPGRALDAAHHADRYPAAGRSPSGRSCTEIHVETDRREQDDDHQRRDLAESPPRESSSNRASAASITRALPRAIRCHVAPSRSRPVAVATRWSDTASAGASDRRPSPSASAAIRAHHRRRRQRHDERHHRWRPDSVTANSRNRRPTMPPISRIGRNTATSDTMLIDSTVKPTSRAPASPPRTARHAFLDVARRCSRARRSRRRRRSRSRSSAPSATGC